MWTFRVQTFILYPNFNNIPKNSSEKIFMVK